MDGGSGLVMSLIDDMDDDVYQSVTSVGRRVVTWRFEQLELGRSID